MTGKRKRGTAYNPTKTNKRKKKGESALLEVRRVYWGSSTPLVPKNVLCSGGVLTLILASIIPSSPHPHGDIDEDTYYQVRTVLAERIKGKKIEYQIDWEDNERTGEKYTPTWEPKENLTERALADWEALKLARKAGMSNLPVRAPEANLVPFKRTTRNCEITTDNQQPNFQLPVVAQESFTQHPSEIPHSVERFAEYFLAPQSDKAVLQPGETQLLRQSPLLDRSRSERVRKLHQLEHPPTRKTTTLPCSYSKTAKRPRPKLRPSLSARIRHCSSLKTPLKRCPART